MADKKTGRQYMTTSFRHGGRRAGIGTLYDDYSEESGGKDYGKPTWVRFPHDNVDPADLNDPVICYKEGSK